MDCLKTRLSTAAVALALSSMASGAVAGGFAIATQGGSGTGNAFAGGAAAAEDASVAWSNPAAMFALPSGSQVSVVGHFILPSFKFTDNGSTLNPALGSGNGGDGGSLAVVPGLFYTRDINPRLRFGFAVNSPFGLSTEYDTGWRGQVLALESSIMTINLSPSLAYKVSDKVSIAGGLNMQTIDATLSAFTGSGAGGILTLEADAVGYGFNLGYFVQATPGTRVGMTYRSKIKYKLEGNASFSGTSGAALGSSARADLEVPDSASLSVSSGMGSQWEFMADVTYTGWSSVQRLDVIRTTGTIAPPPSGGPAGSTLTSLAFNWEDTWRLSVGANYRLSSATKLRFGLAFDPTPTNDVDRTPRLPDQDRTWLAFGVQYKPDRQGTFEFGYAHEFVKDAKVNNAVPAALGGGSLIGTFANQADIFSVQYSRQF